LNGFLHVVEVSDFALLVGNDGEGNFAAGNLVDILDPTLMAAEGVGRQANQLDTTLGELGLELGEGTELGGANGGEILRVGEEDYPFVANKLVEIDRASGGLGLEVGGNAAEAETRTTKVNSCQWAKSENARSTEKQVGLTVRGEIQKPFRISV
jgi:hypothetical protein